MKYSSILIFFFIFGTGLLHAQTEITEPYKKISDHTDDINKLVYNFSTRQFASASYDKSVRIYDENLNQLKFYQNEDHRASIDALCFSKDGKYLYSGSNDWVIVQYDIINSKVLRTIKGNNIPVRALAVDGSGKFLFAAYDEDSVKVFDLSKDAAQKRGISTIGKVNHILASPDGKNLIIATQKPDMLQVDPVGNVQLTFTGHTDQVNYIATSPNGKYIASASSDKTAILWDSKTGAKVRVFTGHELKVNSVALSSDNKYLITASNDKTIRVWDVESGKIVYIIKGNNAIKSAIITIDKKYIISGGKGNSKEKDYGVYVWKLTMDSLEKPNAKPQSNPAKPTGNEPNDKKAGTTGAEPSKTSSGSTNTTPATKPASDPANANPSGTKPATNPAGKTTNGSATKPNNTPTKPVESNPAVKPNVKNSTTPGSTVKTDSANVSMSVDSARIQLMPKQVGDSTMKNIGNEKKSRYKKLK